MVRSLSLFLSLALSFLWAADATLISFRAQAEAYTKSDQLTVHIQLEQLSPSYSTALDSLLNKHQKIQISLKNVEKTVLLQQINEPLNIEKHRIYEESQYKEKGYIAKIGLQLVLKKDLDVIAELLAQITQSDLQPQITVSFGLSKHKENLLKYNLIEKALEDATEKASIFALKLGQKLKKPKSIQYEVPPNYSERALKYAASPEYTNDNAPLLMRSHRQWLDFLTFNDADLRYNVELVVDWRMD